MLRGLSFQSLLFQVWDPAWGCDPTLPRVGSFATVVTWASQLITSSRGLPLFLTPPLTSLYIVFTLLHRQNMSNQLHLPCFFEADDTVF